MSPLYSHLEHVQSLDLDHAKQSSLLLYQTYRLSSLSENQVVKSLLWHLNIADEFIVKPPTNPPPPKHTHTPPKKEQREKKRDFLKSALIIWAISCK